jgi:hypothetical protein
VSKLIQARDSGSFSKLSFVKIGFFILVALLLFPVFSYAGNGVPPSIGNIRIEFILFALTLVGVAVFPNKTFWVALIGFAAILIFKFIFDSSFHFGEHFL